MTHTVTGKLNKAANQHSNQNGMIFFIDIGEQNYCHKAKVRLWTNYTAAIFCKDQKQADYYTSVLIDGAIVSVTGTGLIIQPSSDPKYSPRLELVDAKLVYANSGQNNQAPQQQQTPMQQAPQGQQVPSNTDDFDSDIPFANPYKNIEYLV